MCYPLLQQHYIFYNCHQMCYIINRGPGILAVLWFGSLARPLLSRTLPSASCLSVLVFLCVVGSAYWRERGGGGGRGAESFDQQESLALYKIIQHSLSRSYSLTPPPPCYFTNAKRGNLWRLWHNILEKVGFSIARNFPELNVPIACFFIYKMSLNFRDVVLRDVLSGICFLLSCHPPFPIL